MRIEKGHAAGNEINGQTTAQIVSSRQAMNGKFSLVISFGLSTIFCNNLREFGPATEYWAQESVVEIK